MCQGAGFKVQGSRYRVQGTGFRGTHPSVPSLEGKFSSSPEVD